MISVLHVIDTGGPGGAETVFLNCATRLDPKRFTCTAVISDDAWLAQQLRSRGHEPRIESARGSFNLRYMRRLTQIAREVRANLICAHLYGSAVYASSLSLVSGTPLVSVFHGEADIAPEDRFTFLKAATIRKGSNKVVFVSRKLRTELTRTLGVPVERTAIIPNGVDLEAFRPGTDDSVRRALDLPSEAILVGAIGNIRPAKDYPNLLRAARILVDRSDRFYFAIAGQYGGTLANELMELRNQLQLEDRVFFLGLRSDVATVMQNLDVFVLSSRSEGFSIACVEAMACGIPVVATRCGGPEEILNLDTGILVPPADPVGLADGIHRSARDPDMAQALAAAARRRAQDEYSLHTMLTRYQELFEGVINLARPRPPFQL